MSNLFCFLRHFVHFTFLLENELKDKDPDSLGRIRIWIRQLLTGCATLISWRHRSCWREEWPNSYHNLIADRSSRTCTGISYTVRILLHLCIVCVSYAHYGYWCTCVLCILCTVRILLHLFIVCILLTVRILMHPCIVCILLTVQILLHLCIV